MTVIIYKSQPPLPPGTTQLVLGNPSRGKFVETTKRIANGYASAKVIPPLLLPILPLCEADNEADFDARFPVTQHLHYLPDSQNLLSWYAQCLGLLAKTEHGKAFT